MQGFNELLPSERGAVIRGAEEWRQEHEEHVKMLETSHLSGQGYPPSGSDLFNPMLWKPAHWVWLRDYLTIKERSRD